jgi:hypothetical protein
MFHVVCASDVVMTLMTLSRRINTRNYKTRARLVNVLISHDTKLHTFEINPTAEVQDSLSGTKILMHVCWILYFHV